MVTQEFLQFYKKALEQLRSEIAAYPSEASIWLVPEGISNSGGTLCCHLVGNLQNYIGHGMGNTGYIRDRPLEFSVRDLPKADLTGKVDGAIAMLEQVLPGLDLEAPYPPEFLGQEGSIGKALMHLVGHLNYHLGQVNYHRRLVTKN